jgi:predicted choloylglycine hydrolase
MNQNLLQFDAVCEAMPGAKWLARWQRSWPAYERWFVARGGDLGPSRIACEQALERHMPELVPTYRALVALTGGSDRAARFLATWCPPNYLGGCSLAVAKRDGDIRLVRNYDLSPELNEGLLLRSEWCGRPVMGMVEFLWGLSDGINAAGLSIALAYGGRQVTGIGFGITTILRYVLETCTSVPGALSALARVPSHMPYNVVIADAAGRSASVEIHAGGGITQVPCPIATNHQSDGTAPDRGAFTRTFERSQHLGQLANDNVAPDALVGHFLAAPLRQDRFEAGFGTLFTAEYKPCEQEMILHWPDQTWPQSLASFEEGRRMITYDEGGTEWATPDHASVDWQAVGLAYARGEAFDWQRYVQQWLDAA